MVIRGIVLALLAIFVIPIALVVLWNVIKVFFALISDIGGLIFSILFVVVILVLGTMIF
jgi:hypothetical protein